MPRTITCLIILSAFAAIAVAQPQKVAEPTSAEGWLDRIEQRAETIRTLRANIRYDRVQLLQGDEQRRFGKLLYLAGPPARFDIHFDRMIVDNVPRREDHRWTFDGRWLVERFEQKKQFFKRQIVAPHADAQHTDPLSSGTGPFVLPIRAQKQRLLERFNVVLVPPSDDDPANTIHLQLSPKPHVRTDYDQIDLWYNKNMLLPIKASTRQAGSGNLHVFHLMGELTVNGPYDEDEIDTSVPESGGGWLVEITPWERPVQPEDDSRESP